MFNKSFKTASALTLGVALAIAAASPLQAELSVEDRNARLSTIASESTALQQKALEMERALKVKKPAFTSVGTMLEETSAHIEKLSADVQALGTDSPEWANSSEAYEKMMLKTELLQIFANNKADMLDSPEAQKNRRILAAKAKGIAIRAELLREFASFNAD